MWWPNTHKNEHTCTQKRKGICWHLCDTAPLCVDIGLYLPVYLSVCSIYLSISSWSTIGCQPVANINHPVPAGDRKCSLLKIQGLLLCFWNPKFFELLLKLAPFDGIESHCKQSSVQVTNSSRIKINLLEGWQFISYKTRPILIWMESLPSYGVWH